MDSAAQLPAPARLPFRFTKENARLLAAKSVETRKIKRAEREQALLASEPETVKEPEYQTIRLVRVRKQLDALDRYISRLLNPGHNEDGSPKPIDEQALERAARASRVLSEQEQELSGRPLPGTFRPEKPKHTQRAVIQPIAE